MNSFIRAIYFLFLTALCCACTSNASENLDTDYHDMPLADVNGEILNEADFELSQAWMPPFARQLESSSSLEFNRFWSLIRIMLMAQDAKTNNLLTDAERSLAIKEALAKKNIQSISCPDLAISQAEIDEWIKANPDKLMEPEAWTVNYALIKSENRILPMIAALGLANGAQLGYNFIDPPPIEERGVSFGPQMTNKGGHPMNAKKFNFAFAQFQRENVDEPAQIGPFTADDGLIFSCPEAIEVLKSAPLHQPINRSIACAGEWKAFVIPEWHRDVQRMTEEKIQQIATDSLLKAKQSICQNLYIENKLNSMNNDKLKSEK